MNKTFICIEGVDGESTVAQALCEKLQAIYYKSSGGGFAQARQIVDEIVDPLTRYFFYRAAVQHDSGVIRSLLNMASVVCDRYIYSTFAFHMAMDERIQSLFETTDLIMPDRVILLTADKEVRRRRILQKPKTSALG